MARSPIVIDSLGSYVDYPSHGLSAHCQGCGRWVDLPMRDLAERYGRDVTTSELAGRLRCGKCGSRKIEIQRTVKQEPFKLPTWGRTCKPW